MSASKRPHEEGSRSTPLQRSLEETGVFSVLTGKQTTPLSTDFQVPFEPALDGRMAKLQRTEPHDVDRRSPSLHRKSPSPSNCPDHLNISENRSEIRYSKDGRDVKAASKERSDVRELYSDMRKGPHVSKAGNEVRLDNRGNEGNAAGISDAYWKESKDHDRGKRSFDPIMNLNSNRASLRGSQNTVEIANLITEEWDASEAHDAVGEIRTNRQGEENFTEKDRQKREEKYGDFGEKNRDAQLGEASNEHKELSREEKETERWEREREDSQKGKEFIDKDKDPLKKGSPSANDKGNRPHEVDMVDGSVRMSEQKVITSEPIRHKDDNWKFERDFKDQKREKDADMGDRYEHRGKCFDKELDDGSIEGDGLAERDREVSGNGIQQRRRMQRTRGNSLTPLREPRFRSRARENEGSQGKPEVSAVVYKVGECIQELVKSWKEFEASEETKIDETRPNYPTLEIRVPAEYVTSCNRQVKCAQLWGTDIYTNDSDLLTVLMHTGYCRQTSSLSASTKELRVTVQVLPPQDEYTSTLRNNIRSRAWRAGASCSFCIQQCCIVKKGGGTIDLEHGLTYISALEPTLTPVSVERTMTTRAAASNALRQQRFVREVSIQYNLCNEPWLKYSISVVADKGLKKPLYTSARLKKGEVLFLETYSNRYELCYNGEKVLCNGTGATSFQNHSSLVQNGDKIVAENTVDVYRWSRCKKILPEETMLSSGIPLRAEDLEIIEDNLEWEDLQWSQTGVLVAGKTYNLARVHFLAPKK